MWHCWTLVGDLIEYHRTPEWSNLDLEYLQEVILQKMKSHIEFLKSTDLTGPFNVNDDGNIH